MLDWILSLDQALFTQINSVWTHPWLDSFFPFVTDLHKTPYFKFILIPAVLMIFVWRRGCKKGLIIFFFALLSVGLSDTVGTRLFKNNFERSRPVDNGRLEAIVRSPAGGYSFVSNHAANNFAFAVFTSAFFPAAKLLVFTIAVIISYSRVYNGVHYPTDVLGGAIVGILCGYLISLLCRKVLQRTAQKKRAA